MRILYIDIDTLRADHLGCYGYNRNTSPNIDNIAKEGTIFTQCYASDAPCLPSRAAFFTGRFGIHTGIVGHGGTAADLRLTGKKRGFSDQQKERFWISQLRKRKYYTVSISPFAERHSAFWFYAGWREMYNTGLRGFERADQVFPFAEKWLKENAKNDNWFLHVNFWDPHTPYRTPKSFGNPFESDPAPPWISQEIIDQHRKSYGPHSACEPGGYRSSRHLKSDPRLSKFREIHNLSDFKLWIDGYDVGIRYADEYVGKLIEILKSYNLYNDTIIIISSDHGEGQGELNVYGDHATACHIINRIPMIIKWPNKNWKSIYNSLIYQSDIAATLLEGLNIKVPDEWDGESFYQDLQNGKPFGRKYLVISQNAWSCQRTIRFDNWTLIKTYHTGLKNFPEIMLFDYEKDFHMTKNLASNKPEIVTEGFKFLDEWFRIMMEDSTSEIDPMDTILKEGGPYHTRDQFNSYIKRLNKTGREEMIKVILDKDEPYLS
ncbi:MAG: sulfatase [Candidatus Hodarchaeota archaeon]